MQKEDFEKIFLNKYSSESFLIRKKAQALVYFSIMMASLMIILFFIFFKFNRGILFQVSMAIFPIFLFCILTIFILKSGHFNAAANFITGFLGLAVIAGLLAKVNRDTSTGYTTYIYFMFAVQVQAILFCKKFFVFSISILFIASDVLFFILAGSRLDPVSLKAAKVGVIDSNFAMIMVLGAGLSIMRIVKQAIERSEEESARNTGSLKKIEGLLKSLTVASENLALSSEKLTMTASSFSENTQSQAASAEEIMASIEEVSAGVDNVAANSKEQYERMKDLLNRIHTLSSTITDMGSTIGMTLNVTRDITDYATEGENLLRSMDQSMRKINTGSNEMTNIVGIINDISDRINLLSLNAAIEAARAGDAGRGFAVVADEISKLADQTSLSIKEIESYIRQNNGEIIRGGNIVESTIETISRILGGVNSIKQMIDGISVQMERQHEINLQVNAEAESAIIRSDEMKISTEEQKTAVAEISRSIASVNMLTQSNMEEAEKLFAHAKDVFEQTERLNRQMEQ